MKTIPWSALHTKVDESLTIIKSFRFIKQRTYKYVIMKTHNSYYYVARKGVFRVVKCSPLCTTLDAAISELKRIYVDLEIKPKQKKDKPAKDRPVAFIVTEQDYRNPTKFLW